MRVRDPSLEPPRVSVRSRSVTDAPGAFPGSFAGRLDRYATTRAARSAMAPWSRIGSGDGRAHRRTIAGTPVPGARRHQGPAGRVARRPWLPSVACQATKPRPAWGPRSGRPMSSPVRRQTRLEDATRETLDPIPSPLRRQDRADILAGWSSTSSRRLPGDARIAGIPGQALRGRFVACQATPRAIRAEGYSRPRAVG